MKRTSQSVVGNTKNVIDVEEATSSKKRKISASGDDDLLLEDGGNEQQQQQQNQVQAGGNAQGVRPAIRLTYNQCLTFVKVYEGCLNSQPAADFLTCPIWGNFRSACMFASTMFAMNNISTQEFQRMEPMHAIAKMLNLFHGLFEPKTMKETVFRMNSYCPNPLQINIYTVGGLKLEYQIAVMRHSIMELIDPKTPRHQEYRTALKAYHTRLVRDLTDLGMYF